MDFSFESFMNGSFDYDKELGRHTGLWLREEKMDIGGGRISIADIDVLAQYPDVDTVTISGLDQATFEYFIRMYGAQLKAIRFFKNKRIEDLSLLGSLPQLEYLDFFVNQRIDHLWDMAGNTALTGLSITDFSRLHTIKGVETAPNLTHFLIGNAVWSTAVIDSFMPLAGTRIEHLSFCGKEITDNDYSFLASMTELKSFDFSLKLLTTEQVAWMVANYPQLEGYALCAKRDCMLFKKGADELVDVPSTIIVGKRKPSLNIEGNEKKIEKYVAKFEELKEKYRGYTYREVFGDLIVND